MKKLYSILAILFLAMAMNQAFAQFSTVYVFGDSLSDEGYQDLNPGLNGKRAIWTTPNGHTWAYYVAQYLANNGNITTPNFELIANNQTKLTTTAANYVSGNLAGTDYAAGGSTTDGQGFFDTEHYLSPSLFDQICYFTNGVTSHDCILNHTAPTHTLDPNALYIIWSGSNDIYLELDSRTPNFSNAKATLIANNIFSAIQQLQNASPNHTPLHILLMNMTAINITPGARLGALGNKEIQYALGNFLLSINNKIANQSTTINQTGTSHILVVSTFNDLMSLVQYKDTIKNYTFPVEGENFHFLNINFPIDCLEPLALTCSPTVADAGNYLFADPTHPSDELHHMIGAGVYGSLKRAGWAN
jgi:phospholipase/lecithinase/hemolysin